MKILVLSNSPAVESQGSGYIIVNTVRSLEALGHQVDVVPPDELIVLPGWRNRARNYRMALGFARWVYAHRRRVATYQLIMVYGGESALAVFVLRRLLRLGIPLVLHSNGLEAHVNYRLRDLQAQTQELKWYNFDQSWLFKYCYRHVDAIITLSHYDRDFALEHLGLDPQKVHVLEPCLPEVFFSYAPAVPVVRQPIIVYCGTWIPRKGTQAIREAVPKILAEHPGYSLRIIGAGRDFVSAENFAPDVVQRLEVYPLVESKEEMIRLYSESEIFVFPSIHESFGLVIAEAMHCGCAVISGYTGFATNVENGREALVLRNADGPHVYQALEQLIHDDDLRERLAAAGRQRTQRLQWSIYRQQLAQVLDTVLAGHAVAP